tara:strand:- start:404 stop:1681 length:1278 start_codon:yes stop_codon:yes gene_type:complete
MKIGFIGIGKLGLPTCIGFNKKGHTIYAYDIDPKINKNKTVEEIYKMKNIKELDEDNKTDLIHSIKNIKINFVNLEEVLINSEIIFVAVQTPHNKLFEGITPISNKKNDFNYKFLIKSIKNISLILDNLNISRPIVIISTVLPGTIRREILPIMSKNIKLCYNPYFIAMGTVLNDLYNPEFILLGVVDKDVKNLLLKFYKTITNSSVFTTNLENAEMIKVSYNTFITSKICLANNIMIMCDKLKNTNCDIIMKALKLANRRIISPQYLNGGMGDGGGCHPRDNIALSWLSNKHKLSFNYYDSMMKCRDEQTKYISEIIISYKHKYPNYPITILGLSFKKETNLLNGSPALLLIYYLENKGIKIYNKYDPYINKDKINLNKDGIYCFTTNHDCFKKYKFTENSVVIDPFRFLENINCIYYPIGINK